MSHNTQTHPINGAAKRFNYQTETILTRGLIFRLFRRAYTLSRLFEKKLARYRSRRQLVMLDADQLKDIGITREQALDEANRPFWN